MSTPYTAIFNRAIFRLSDAKLARMNCQDQQFILGQYLESAVSDFCTKCKVDLSERVEDMSIDEGSVDGLTSYNTTNQIDQPGFVADLSAEEQEILALGISYYWLSAQIMNSELLKNKLSTKDYQYFSPANLMREVQTLRESVRTEYKHRIISYTYDHGDIAMEGTN